MAGGTGGFGRAAPPRGGGGSGGGWGSHTLNTLKQKTTLNIKISYYN